MKELIEATIALIPANLKHDEAAIKELTESVIAEHQRQYPASWQDWTTKKIAKKMARIITNAIKGRETIPARIFLKWN